MPIIKRQSQPDMQALWQKGDHEYQPHQVPGWQPEGEILDQFLNLPPLCFTRLKTVI